MVEHRDALGDLGGMVHLRERVEDARPDVDALGRLREVAGHHVVGGEMRVLVEEVVLREPYVLESGAIGGFDCGDLVHERAVLGSGEVIAPPERRVVSLDEDSELHGRGSTTRGWFAGMGGMMVW